MTYSTVAPNLYQISLDQKLTGFQDFINCWLYKSDAITFLVDPGPEYSINQLFQTLKEVGVRRVDYILLTHIHIDHAGGTGALLKHFPDTRIICHPKAIPHMISPDILWRGSLKTLGKIAEAYGKIVPVSEKSIEYSEQIPTASGDIRVIETPGHAVHHLCFEFQGCIFAGETVGFTYALKQGIYSRPSTPPKFKLDTSLASIDRLIPIDAALICFGHYGFRTDTGKALKEAKEQLLLWVDTAKSQLQKDRKNIIDRTISILKKEDTAFARIQCLPEDIRQREIYFTGNSLNGIIDYLHEKTVS